MTTNAIYADNDTMGGTPVFVGTRVPVQYLFDWLETETLDEFLENFPTVTRQQCLEILLYAEQLVKEANHRLNENFA